MQHNVESRQSWQRANLGTVVRQRAGTCSSQARWRVWAPLSVATGEVRHLDAVPLEARVVIGRAAEVQVQRFAVVQSEN